MSKQSKCPDSRETYCRLHGEINELIKLIKEELAREKKKAETEEVNWAWVGSAQHAREELKAFLILIRNYHNEEKGGVEIEKELACIK